VLGPLVASRELGGAAAWGVVLTGGAVGGLIGGAVSLRWKPARPLVPGFLLMILAQVQLVLLIPPFPTPILALGALITIAAIVISNTFWDTMLQQRIPPQALSRVSSYDWMGSLIFQPIAFASIGPLSEVIGIERTLVVAAAIGVAVNAGVLLVPSVRRLRRLEGPPASHRAEVTAAAGEATEPPLTPAGS